MANAKASKGHPTPTVDLTLSPFAMNTRQSEKSAKKPAHSASTAPMTRNIALVLKVFMRVQIPSNEAHQWRTAKNARNETDAQSARPLNARVRFSLDFLHASL